ncbi:dephospho-CoA kinase [uncultured Roseobacter sp.]|uniref:dephospho-CoA kinase n=1 Tax=uncultured Roseobacter sp. TaxID=114847 RepID=UPI00260D462A|nr:dephospho-CoA kinase [uncultured Roseobacter sp.]
MTHVIALTGSIGMGKSTTAQMFADEGCAVWDADAAVHRLYEPGGAAVAPVSRLFPEAIISDAVSRDRLRKIISADPDALKKIEDIVHPLVAADRVAFLKATATDIAVLDIPLLFETGGEGIADTVVCVFVSDEEQEKRVLARGKMTREQFLAIREKQMPAAEKCARSDFVVTTDTIEHARQQVQNIVRQIREASADA